MTDAAMQSYFYSILHNAQMPSKALFDHITLISNNRKAADTRQTNVNQQKSVVCSKSWPTFYVGQQCWRFMNTFVLCCTTCAKSCTVIGWLCKHHGRVDITELYLCIKKT